MKKRAIVTGGNARPPVHWICSARWRLVALSVVLGTAASVFGQGTVNFSNRVPTAGIDAPVYDVDWTTRLGTSFRAQLYFGPYGDPGSMVAVGTPVAFGSGPAAGYFYGGTITLPGVIPGSIVWVQVRVWEAACGATYEQAVAAGGACRVGVSAVLAVVVSALPAPPAPLSGLQSFAVTRLGTPFISNIPNQFTPQAVATGAIPFTVGDATTPAGNLTLGATSSNTNLLSIANILFGGSGSNRTVTLTPNPSAVGTSTITVTVSDGTNTASDSFILTVSNTAPVLAPIPNKTVVKGHLVEFTLSASDASAPPQALTFGGLSLPAGATVSSNGIFSWIPSPAQAGTNVIIVEVHDNGSPPLTNVANFIAVVLVTTIDVLVNEWLAAPELPQTEFVELYNAGANPVDLSGYYLTDDGGATAKFPIPLATTISPGAFLAFATEGAFNLASAGGLLGLYLPGTVMIDEVIYGPQVSGLSQGRWPNGGTNIVFLTYPTPGGGNVAGPVIIEQPASQAVSAGSTVAFTVTAGGNPPLAYQWLRQGSNSLAGATSPSLVLTNVQPGAAGLYSVRVSNTLGVAFSASALLTVQARPAILVQPTNQTVALGGTVVFSVSASGDPPPTVQWRHNGVNIPGATNATLVIPSAQAADGGSYSAVVANAAGAVLSSPAQLLFNVTSVAANDNFVNRLLLAGASGTVRGSNTFATRETGEPTPTGRPGGRSVWYRWVAPTDGNVTFSTAGSTFDTLLGIYTGTSVNALTVADSDDDRGGALTSEVRCNVASGTSYNLLIDGEGGQAGEILLSWLFESAVALPVITNQPVGGTVIAGSNFPFTVVAGAPSGGALSYQWLFASNSISGATGATYVVVNVQSNKVGTYVVRVTASGRTIESRPAVLEIGRRPTAQSRDKIEDLFAPPSPPTGFRLQEVQTLAAAPGGGNFVPVTLGTTDSQVMDNQEATTSLGEPAHCGVTGGASKWYGLRPLTDGTLVLDTTGSTFDTVMAVYAPPKAYADYANAFLFWADVQANYVACDNNGAPDGIRSQVSFDVKGGTNYLAAIDGVPDALGNVARGTIQLNWRFIPKPPVLAASSATQLVRLGCDLALDGRPSPPLANAAYQWRFKGVNVSGATNASLYLCNLQMGQAGRYSVLVGNAAVAATSQPIVRIAVGELKYQWSPGGFSISGRASQEVDFDDTTDLKAWSPIFPQKSAPFTFQDSTPHARSNRFFRIKLTP